MCIRRDEGVRCIYKAPEYEYSCRNFGAYHYCASVLPAESSEKVYLHSVGISGITFGMSHRYLKQLVCTYLRLCIFGCLVLR